MLIAIENKKELNEPYMFNTQNGYLVGTKEIKVDELFVHKMIDFFNETRKITLSNNFLDYKKKTAPSSARIDEYQFMKEYFEGTVLLGRKPFNGKG